MQRLRCQDYALDDEGSGFDDSRVWAIAACPRRGLNPTLSQAMLYWLSVGGWGRRMHRCYRQGRLHAMWPLSPERYSR